MGQHLYRPGNQWGVTVAELIERVKAEGLPVRLAWRGGDEVIADDYPTGYLPVLRDELPDPETSRKVG
jgi:hypothetical protein